MKKIMTKIRENNKKPMIKSVISFKPYPDLDELEKTTAQIEDPENGPEIIKLRGQDISTSWEKV